MNKHYKFFKPKSFFYECQQKLEHAIRYDTELSLLVIDIENFKVINDTFGHHAGDKAIIAATQKITDSIRTTDIFGRIRGEEFALLMPATGRESALQLGERIRLNIAEKKIEFEDQVLQV